MTKEPVTANGRKLCSRVWVMSDLQTSSPGESRRNLGSAIADIEELGVSLDQLWYLGDAVKGTDNEINWAVAETQLDILSDLEVPCRYVMGNHDLDYPSSTGTVELPFYELARDHPNWQTTPDPESFYFVDEIGNHSVLFLSDHVALDNSWSVAHGRIRGDEDAYPYDKSDYRAAITEASESGKPLLIAGHNAFAGGNRPATIQNWFMPLPEETVMHLYGHAHIGDEKNIPRSSGRFAYRAISTIDHHQISQIDVASLEDRRGDVIRSAILETYNDGRCTVHLRDHSNQTWVESYSTYGSQRTYITQLRSGEETDTFSSPTQRKQLQDILSHLASEHDLFKSIELPYALDESPLVLANESSEPNSDELHRPLELPEGHFVEDRIGKPIKRRLLANLAAHCDVTVEFAGLWHTLEE